MITSPQIQSTIDPTEGLVQYTLAVKPYHTKILEVLIEHVFKEKIDVTVNDQLFSHFEFKNTIKDTVYTCGYGWSFSPTAQLDSTLVSRIISARTSDNSFLIEPATSATLVGTSYVPLQPYSFAVINKLSNQLAVVTPYTITGVTPGVSGSWIVSGDASSLVLNDVIYISENTGSFGTDGNGKYTVFSSSYSIPFNETTIQVNESISPLANPDGDMNIPLDALSVPAWPMGLQVTVSLISGTLLPHPLAQNTPYYFIPSNQIGIFNLANKPYPTAFDDFIHVNAFGQGRFEIQRAESFFPGSRVGVDSSFYSSNNQLYTVIKTVPEGPNVRVYVANQIPRDTPISVPFDGVMSQRSSAYSSGNNPLGYGGGYCPPAQSSDLHTEAMISERITFEFSIVLRDVISSTATEIPPSGYGDEFSQGMGNGFGTSLGINPWTKTTVMTGPGSTYTILPDGFDLRSFDVGGMGEDIL